MGKFPAGITAAFLAWCTRYKPFLAWCFINNYLNFCTRYILPHLNCFAKYFINRNTNGMASGVFENSIECNTNVTFIVCYCRKKLKDHTGCIITLQYLLQPLCTGTYFHASTLRTDKTVTQEQYSVYDSHNIHTCH